MLLRDMVKGIKGSNFMRTKDGLLDDVFKDIIKFAYGEDGEFGGSPDDEEVLKELAQKLVEAKNDGNTEEADKIQAEIDEKIASLKDNLKLDAKKTGDSKSTKDNKICDAKPGNIGFGGKGYKCNECGATADAVHKIKHRTGDAQYSIKELPNGMFGVFEEGKELPVRAYSNKPEAESMLIKLTKEPLKIVK